MVERFLGVEEVVGSNPVAPTIYVIKKTHEKIVRLFGFMLLAGFFELLCGK